MKVLRCFLGGVLLTMSLTALAMDLELSAESVSVSEDAKTTTYSGDVNLRVPTKTQFTFKAAKTRAEGAAQVLEGNVEIVVEGLVIRTQRAIMTRDGATLIRMDEAVVSEASPAL